MYKKSDIAKLEVIVKYIDDIQLIISNHNDIASTLLSKEGEYAIMMCIVQMGEAVSKLTDINIIEKLPVSKIVGLRNRIVHGYEAFDRKIITEVIRTHIPELKDIIIKIIGEE